MEEAHLAGGVANKGSVVRVGDTVRRPVRAQSEAVAALLVHLEAGGFPGAPRFLGFDDSGREVLSWIPGDAPLPPFPSWAMADDALLSLARLLRAFHDAVEGFFLSGPNRKWSTEMADPSGGDLVCHNDVCPENVVFRDGRAVAFIDFDFAAPGRRIWDVVGTLSMWAPLTASEWRSDYPIVSDPVDRAADFADAYGLAEHERKAFVPTLRERWRVGRSFVRRQLEARVPAFEEMAAEHGAEDRWEATDRWLDREESNLKTRLGE
jgi:Phosphotransferase enzyme family